jgi:methylphosphotriester-DNA--protein-cysteine methyltransferase
MNDYERVARVIRYLDERHTDQPNLTTLARHVGLSQHHFHRLFTSWAGITPKDFLQCLTLTHAKRLLRNGKSVLDVSLDMASVIENSTRHTDQLPRVGNNPESTGCRTCCGVSCGTKLAGISHSMPSGHP